MSATAQSSSQGPTARKPVNILFCIADDAGHMSAYGTPWVHTPAFDRVAREGVLFQNAYTCNAKSAPSRAAFITGRNSWQLKEACNHWPKFPAEFKSYPEVLAGRSFMDILKDESTDTDRGFVLIGKERHDVGRPDDQGYPIRGLIRGDYLYLRNFETDRWPAGNPETGYMNVDGSPTKTEVLPILFIMSIKPHSNQ